MNGPLDGIKVLDLSQGAAGPTCAMHLGDLGAEVIKVEPPGGDWARDLGPPFVAGVAASFLGMNRNKRGVVVDLKQPGGAEVVLTRSDVAKGHPEYYQDLAKTIAEQTPGAYFINQFGNPDNPAAHEFGTGPEILEQMGGDLDAIVFGCGSSGTMTGLSRAFAKLSPKTELVLADPVGSILAEYINDGVLNDKSGSWLVEGKHNRLKGLKRRAYGYRNSRTLLLRFLNLIHTD